MPYSAGPNIAARPNLVFEYDTGDVQNSYKGEPTTNLVGSPFSVTSGYATTIATRTDNAVLNWNGQNTGGLLSGNGYFAYVSAATTNGNQYTTSWYIKGGTFTTPYFTWGGAHQGNTTNFTFDTTTGAFSGVSQAAGEIYGANNLGNGWWRVYYSSTLTSGNNYYPQLNINGTFYVGGLQIEQKNHPTPFVVGTRSNTQGLLDVSGLGNTIDLANMSYTSTAQPTFDGTDDYSLITNSSALQIVDGITIESVVRVNSSNLGNVKVMANKYYTTGWEFVLGSDGTFALGGRNGDGNYYSSNSGVVIADNKFHHVVGIKSGLYWQTYVDGVLKSTLTASSIGTLSNSGDVQLGKEGSSYFTAMSMNMFRIYNIALSAQEVLRNYNQLKE